MEVSIFSNLPGVLGRTVLTITPDLTIKSIIATFCEIKEITESKSFVLKTQHHELLDRHKTVSDCDIKDGDVFFISVQDQYFSNNLLCGLNRWAFLALVSLFIGLIGLVAVAFIQFYINDEPYRFAVVMDAGSSHTQLYTYKWLRLKTNGTAVARQSFTCRSKGSGISHYSTDPTVAGRSLQSCLSLSQQRRHGGAPRSLLSNTPVFLGATAGMRLLREADRSASRAVMKSVRDTISTFAYNFSSPKKQAYILSGKDEGSFGWITVNYLLENFVVIPESFSTVYVDSGSFYGALDMGGASTQVTFLVPRDYLMPPEYRQSLLLYGYQYDVYTHSYLCYGLNEATRRFMADLVLKANPNVTDVENPCAPKGSMTSLNFTELFEVPCTKEKITVLSFFQYRDKIYKFHGTGNNSECLSNTLQLFNFSTPCPYSSCSFNGIYQPRISGKFMAFSGYPFIVEFFNSSINGQVNLTVFQTNRESFCKKPWSEVSKMPQEKKYLLTFCLHAYYIDIFLTRALHFNESGWKNILFKNNITDTDLGWSLGFLLNTSNLMTTNNVSSPPFSIPVFSLLIVLFVLFLFVSCGFIYYAKKSSRSRLKDYTLIPSYGSIET